MDAFDQADAVVQVMSGLLGVAVMAYFAYRMFFGRKKASSGRRKPGEAAAGVQRPVAGDAVPASLDEAGPQAQSLPQPQGKTVSGFAKWWLIFWLVANIGGALAPAGALTNSPAPGLAALVMLLCAASAVGYYWLLRRKPTGLYVILAANTLGAFLNGVAVPGYSIMVTTGLVPAIITYFITRKQVAYPFGRSGRENAAAPVPADEPSALTATLPPAAEPSAIAAATPVDTRTAGEPARKSRRPLAYALIGAGLTFAIIAAIITLSARQRSMETASSIGQPMAAAETQPAAGLVAQSRGAQAPQASALPAQATGREEALTPQAGRWEGDPSVSFYVIGDDLVHDLEMTFPFGMSRCTLKLSELAIGPDAEITSGEPDGETLSGNFKSTLYVTARFTGETALAGTYRISICHQSGETYTVVDPPVEGAWSAEWQDSSIPPTVAPSVAPSRTPAPMPTRTPAATATPRPSPTAAPTIEVASPVALAEALEQRLADIQILGMGAASGASIQVIARAAGSQSVSIGIAPGTVLRSSVPGEQDMVVRQLLGLRQGEQRYVPADVIFLHAAAAEPMTYIVDAYCLNFHKGNPSATTSFSIDADTAVSPDVAAVLAAAGRVPGAAQDIAAIQAAVWTVTDRPTLQELASRGYSPNREMLAALLQSAGLDGACAQLFGQACTVPDCGGASNPTGQGGTRAGPCVSRQPGITLAAPAAAALPEAATPTGTTVPDAAATTTVLDAQVRKLFAPGPDTAGIAITGDAIWVADGGQGRIHRLDRSGAPVSSFQVKTQGEYRGLAWDGEALRLLVYDYQAGSQVQRLDAQGKVLSSFTVPADLHALAWDEGDSSLWTIASGSEGFLLEFDADGELRQTFQVPVFGNIEGLALAGDGLWVLSGFGKWYRFSFEGEYLASAKLPMEVFAKDPALAWDEEGSLWVSVAETREIYQFALRGAAVDAELPSELRSSSEARTTGELPLPEPALRALGENANAVARVANGLSAPLIVSLDSMSGGDVHESAVVAPGDTWSAAIAKGGAFTLFATANAAEPVAYFDKILLLAGYEYTWIIGDAVTIAPPPTAAPTARPASPTAVPPTAAPVARSATPTRAPARPAAAPAATCPDTRARITYPANGAAISGVTNFLGTANLPDQAYYKFEYKPASSPTWQYLTQVNGKTVIEDKLMDFFTTTIAPGVYDFRLIVVDRSGNYPAPCEIRLTVRR